MKCLAAVIATAAVTFAVPSPAQAATLVADPELSCYPERFQVFLPGEGFTPGAQVNFTRDAQLLPADPPILADQAGAISANLTLPELLKGQDTLDYLATDTANPANTAALSLLVTATEINLDPEEGTPERLLTIRARGFFGGGKRLWAHVKRKGGRRSRNVKVGRIKGPCKKVKAKRRLFSAGVPSGEYRVQFDAFRRFRKKRDFEETYNVTITRTEEPAIASAGSGVPAWRPID